MDRSKISVSGFSAGGMMSTQMHVAYSSVIMGAGIISGGTVQRRRSAFIDRESDFMNFNFF